MTEKRIEKLEAFVGREENGQKWRRITPLTVITNIFTNFVGFGLLSYFGNYYISNEDKKFEVLFQAQKEIREAAASTSKCFNQNFYKTNCRGCDIC